MQDGKSKTNGRFLPGNTLGTGRPAFPKYLREFSRDAKECIIKTLTSDPAYLEQIKNDPKSTLLEIIVAKYAYEAAKGSVQHLQVLLDRSLGRVKEMPEQSEAEHNEVIEMIPKEKLLEFVSSHYDAKRDSNK